MKSSRSLMGASLLVLAALPVNADEKNVTLEPIEVTAPADSKGTLTVPDNTEAKEQIRQTPGGVHLVEGQDIENRFSQNYEETLFLAPGVSARKRFAEEVRLSIRGSGLSRGYHMRGIKLLQDGVPFNLADGSADFQELDPNITQRIEIHKGGNALQFGATSLGGAVNTVTKTGRSNPGYEATISGGSFDTYRGNVQAGQFSEKFDIFASLTGTTSSGYREHEDQQSVKFNANTGIRINDDLETRFYISANDIDQQLAGSISRDQALNSPEDAASSAKSADWQRDIRSLRLANKTTYTFGDDEQIDIGAYVNFKDLFHPITPFVGIIDQQSRDMGAFAQISGNTTLAGRKNSFRLGFSTQWGQVDANVFANVGGHKGAQTANRDQEAVDAVFYGENAFHIIPELAFITGAQLTAAYRKVDDNFVPSESDSKTYTSINPKVGLLYEPAKDLQFFANVSYSDEVPTFSELTQSGTVGFTPVDSQKAWTAEIGTRGESGRFSWDLSVYRAWLKDEMLQFTTGGGIPASTFNADETVHQGIELGFAVKIAEGLFRENDNLIWKNAYTLSDFHFVDDDQYGDNRIPGIARHVYQSELRYESKNQWFIAPSIEVSSSADVDYENTLNTPGFMVLNLAAGYNFTDNLSAFIDARNLLDKRYISTFSTIINGLGNTNVYYPGQGRSVFMGLKAKF